MVTRNGNEKGISEIDGYFWSGEKRNVVCMMISHVGDLSISRNGEFIALYLGLRRDARRKSPRSKRCDLFRNGDY